MNVDSSDAERSGDGTSVLPSSAAEARQNMTRCIVTTSLLMTIINTAINVIVIIIIIIIVLSIIIVH